jgi:hypothetical protein
VTVDQSLKQSFWREALVLFIGEWHANLIEANCVKNTQRLAHVNKIVAVIDVENRFSKRSRFQKLFLPVYVEFMSGGGDTSVYSLDQIRPDELDIVVGFGGLVFELLNSI